jgi:hypothetical protein
MFFHGDNDFLNGDSGSSFGGGITEERALATNL